MPFAASAGINRASAEKSYSYVATKPDERNWIANGKLTLSEDSARRRDLYYQALGKPAEWYLEPLKRLQPRSHEAFFRGGPPELLLMEHVWEDIQFGWMSRWDLFMHTNDRLVLMRIGDGLEGYGERLQLDGWMSLPESLSRSWLWRATDWGIPLSLPSSPMVHRQMMRSIIEGIDNVISSFGVPKAEQRRMLHSLVNRFPDIQPDRQRTRWNLRCFLDTRPMGVDGPVGDQLLTRLRNPNGEVYRIRNGDASGLHVLRDPGDALDCYHEHLLLKRPGEFDFSPWARPLT